MSVVDLIAKPH